MAPQGVTRHAIRGESQVSKMPASSSTTEAAQIPQCKPIIMMSAPDDQVPSSGKLPPRNDKTHHTGDQRGCYDNPLRHYWDLAEFHDHAP